MRDQTVTQEQLELIEERDDDKQRGRRGRRERKQRARNIKEQRELYGSRKEKKFR